MSCQVTSDPISSKPPIDKPEQESATDVGLGGIALGVGEGDKVETAVGGVVGDGIGVSLGSGRISACGVR